MAKFAYNNAKNANTRHRSFELNCGYYPRASYKENVNPRSQLKSAKKLAKELRDLMTICRENLYYT